MNSEICIINYDKRYINDVREIFNKTAFMGEDIDNFFSNRIFMAYVATLYYLRYEPESTFLAYDKSHGRIAGYIMGCANTRRYHLIMNTIGIPLSVTSFFSSGTIFQPACMAYLARLVISALLREAYPSVPLDRYPAHLHINVLEEYRSSGIGSRMMSRYIDYLHERRVLGVHLHTSSWNEAAIGLYKKFGFNEIGKKESHLYDYITPRPFYLITMAKEL
ncbi:GNAT family N-acetyltransferase [Mahella australiensis]|uniref:GCN5-related N-acetyltransferase n=1 Tax=Mahella australiensis (strain DSM 15567 / CIP 107919 / 50-1 BON) TaxID=697281 RepID=F4A0C4_MAHA5|nr:GNAT family N-acetyltransferase [Mahella australiensis]AEE97985.1 GCN5-related N-acetyltransferase [Mahella australiensis 50-1 BON]